MELTIMNQGRTFELYGYSKIHDPNKSYGQEIIELLDRVWPEVRSKGYSHAGINHVVYDADGALFAGIGLLSPPDAESSLQKREWILQKYASYTHIGPYSLLGAAHSSIQSTLKASGESYMLPTLEIYGHWNEDESKLETEILYTLQ